MKIQDLINKGKEILKFKPQPIDSYSNPLDYILNSNNGRSSVVYPTNDFSSKCEAWMNDVKNEVKDFYRTVTVPSITENTIEEYANAVDNIIKKLENLNIQKQ